MWDDKYLKGRHGGIKIEVTTKKPGKIVEPQIMTLKKFLLRYYEVTYSKIFMFRD